MSSSASTAKPRPVSGIDIRLLPIGPQDAFVLSRVDGNATAREIGYATSMSEDQVVECLNRLESLGAIEYTAVSAMRVDALAPPPLQSNVGPQASVLPNSGTVRIAHAAPNYDPSELDSPSDLDHSKRREILDLYYQLDSLDHFQLLGVERSAEKKAIKAAYYDKVKTFHPDRYFGKNLGAFRSKLEECFARLTQAHDTLASVAKREEYEAYLESQNTTRELERALSDSVSLEDFDLLERRMAEALATRRSSPLDAGGTASPTPLPSVPPNSSVTPKMSDEERRRHLANKLRLSSASLRAPPRDSASSPPVSSVPSREELAEQLRRQLGGARREDQYRQLARHLAAAETALASNDPVAATNALRVAHSLAPKDATIRDRLSQTQALAAASLSDTYLHQAEYEEKSGRFEAAARSYERAANGKPNAATWEAAARCLLAAEGDLRTASEFARKSISLAPERAASHLLLGQIFVAARMRTSAIAELERARRLDPNNDTVVSLLKRIANEEF